MKGSFYTKDSWKLDLEKQPKAFKRCVQIKILSLDKPSAISYVRLKASDPMLISENDGMIFSFNIPEMGENEGVFETIGFKSLEGGEMIQDVRPNGIMMISF